MEERDCRVAFARLRRGDLCRASVPQFSLPPAGSAPVDVTTLSPRAGAFLRSFRDRMLAPDGEALVAASGARLGPHCELSSQVLKATALDGAASTNDVAPLAQKAA